MQTEDNQDAASASKSSDGESSSADVVNEDLFIKKLVQFASAGELSSKDEVLEVYLDTFAEDPEVSLDFVDNLTRRLAQRPDSPFESIIKDYVGSGQTRCPDGRTKIDHQKRNGEHAQDNGRSNRHKLC